MPFLSGYDGLELKKYQNSTFSYLVWTEEWIRICSQNNRFLQIFNGDYYCALVHTHILCVVLVHCLDVSPKSTFQTAVFDLFFCSRRGSLHRYFALSVHFCKQTSQSPRRFCSEANDLPNRNEGREDRMWRAKCCTINGMSSENMVSSNFMTSKL